MGWFSTKYKTQVATTVSRVIEDNLLPDSVKTGVIKSILQDSGITHTILDEVLAGPCTRVERAYQYGEKKYLYGLPSGQKRSSLQGRSIVKALLTEQHKSEVVVEYSHFGSPNTLHIGWVGIVNNYGYDQASNELKKLSLEKKTPVYLKDIVVVIPTDLLAEQNLSELSQWGIAARAGYTPERLANVNGLGNRTTPSPIQVNPVATEEHALVTYVWNETVTAVNATGVSTTSVVIREGSFKVPVTDYLPSEEYFHAKYSVGAATYYWMYQYGAGTYPALDQLFETEASVSGTYFPFAYFRFNKTAENSNQSSESYKSNKKLVDRFGFDYDQMATAINDNPDIKDVEQAMMFMAVPAESQDPTDQHYLFDYFNNYYEETEGQYVAPVEPSKTFEDLITKVLKTIITGFRKDPNAPASTTIIQDRRFKMALGHNGVSKTWVAGSIGKVGSYNSEIATVSTTVYVTEFRFNQGMVSVPKTVLEKVHIYRKQVTENIYEEVSVRKLQMVYYVFGEYKTTGDEDDDILLVPLDRSITKTYAVTEREILYCRSFHLVFNSRVVTKVKWYQTGFFKALLILAAIVFTIATGFSDGGQTAAAVLGMTTTQYIIYTLVINFVIGQIISIAMKYVAKVFGADVAQILAVLLIFYGAYKGYQAGSIGKIPYASEMLQMVNGLQASAVEMQMNDLLGEFTNLSKFVEEQTKTLDAAKSLLEEKVSLDPFIIFGEKPADFYNRTVHSGNIGIIGLDAVSSYVDLALTLPSINETLGGKSWA